MNENKELLEEIKIYIEKANNKIESIVEEVKKEQNSENLINLIEGLSYCIEGIYNLYIIDNLEIENIGIYREKFGENLNQIMESLENKDIGLLCDILEYEIVDLISDLNNDIKNINLV